MKHKLMPMLDYVWWLQKLSDIDLKAHLNKLGIIQDETINMWHASCLQATFLSQAPELSMFVPVGENGEILEKPIGWGSAHDPDNPLPDEYLQSHKAYEKALERCVFEGAKYEIIHETRQYMELSIGRAIIGKHWHVNGKPEFTWYFNTIEDIIIAINKNK